MKVSITLIAALLLSACGHANKQSVAAADTAASDGDKSAIAVCRTIVTAAVKKDFETVKDLSMRPEMPKKKNLSKKGFNEMHSDHLSELKDLSCLREMVSEDHAVVEAESQGGKRLIPFVKTAMGWKFDAGTYMAFYDYPEKK